MDRPGLNLDCARTPMRAVVMEPMLRMDREDHGLFAGLQMIDAFLKLASTLALGADRQRLRCAVRGLTNLLPAKLELVPPDIPALIDAHLVALSLPDCRLCQVAGALVQNARCGAARPYFAARVPSATAC